jgi:hypothetical protein
MIVCVLSRETFPTAVENGQDDKDGGANQYEHDPPRNKSQPASDCKGEEM